MRRRAGKDLEYDFVVAPGADPSRISMTFDGAKGLEVDGKGDLLIDLGKDSVLRHRAPVLYQEVDGRRTPVQGRYTVEGTTVGFEVGSYDPSRTLTIDPLLYSTVIGTSRRPPVRSKRPMHRQTPGPTPS